MISRRTALGSLAAALFAMPARAESALKIVYPFPAGGAGDSVARIFADHLQKSLGRPVIVENKTGAGGRVGVIAMKEAAPDGSVLLFTATGQLAIQPHVTLKAGYDPFKDLRPIAEIATSELALAVSATLDIRTVDELLNWLRSHPERATFASAGTGTSGYFAGLEFARTRAVELRHVPYRGAAAAIPDVVAGRVPVVVAITAELLPHQASNGIRILATTGTERSPFLSGVPTFKEVGVDLIAPNGYAFFAPALMSNAIAERLEQAIVSASQAPEIKNKLAELNLKQTGLTAKELGSGLREQYERWRAVVQASGFKPE